MIIDCVERQSLLLIIVKLIDKSVNKITWIETANNLSRDFDINILTGWRDCPIELCVSGRKACYFPQIGRGYIQKISRYVLMNKAVEYEIIRLRPKVVIVNCIDKPGVLKAAYWASKKSGCRLIYDIRTLPTCKQSSLSFYRFGVGLRFAASHYAGVTYITEEMRSYCVKSFNLPEHRSAIWTSGVNAEQFTMSPIQKSDESFRLLYHGGSISVSRGLDRLIQAIALVKDLNVTLSLIGSLRDPEAVDWVKRLNLGGRVTFFDSIPHSEVPNAIQHHDAGILPFPWCDVWNTSSPIKLFEYMACGKPVIVTDIPAHSNVLAGRPFAFFARDSSPASLADAIRRAYESRACFPQLGLLARKQVIEKHTWERQAEVLREFVKEII